MYLLSHICYTQGVFSPFPLYITRLSWQKGGGGEETNYGPYQIFYFSRFLVNDTRQMEVFYEFMSFLLGNCCSFQPILNWIMCEFRENAYYFLRIMLGLFKIYPEEKHLWVESLKWIKETDSNLQLNLLISSLS